MFLFALLVLITFGMESEESDLQKMMETCSIERKPNALNAFDKQNILLFFAKFLTPEEFLHNFRPLNRKTSNIPAKSYLFIYAILWIRMRYKSSSALHQIQKDPLSNSDFKWLFKFLSVKISQETEKQIKKFYTVPILWDTIIEKFLQLCVGGKSLVLYSFFHYAWEIRYTAKEFKICLQDLEHDDQPYLQITYRTDDPETPTIHLRYFLEMKVIAVRIITYERQKASMKYEEFEDFVLKNRTALSLSLPRGSGDRPMMQVHLITEKIFFPKAVLQQFQKNSI